MNHRPAAKNELHLAPSLPYADQSRMGTAIVGDDFQPLPQIESTFSSPPRSFFDHLPLLRGSPFPSRTVLSQYVRRHQLRVLPDQADANAEFDGSQHEFCGELLTEFPRLVKRKFQQTLLDCHIFPQREDTEGMDGVTLVRSHFIRIH